MFKESVDKRPDDFYVSGMVKNEIAQNRLREVRRLRNLRQVDLAREIGVTRQTILAIEKGRLNPSVTIALRLAEALNEPIGGLFFLAVKTPESPRTHKPLNVQEPVRPAAVWDFV